MPNNFNKWKSIYDAEDLIPFTENKEALLWLKVKSVVRKEIINEFCSANHIVLETTSLTSVLVLDNYQLVMSCKKIF